MDVYIYIYIYIYMHVGFTLGGLRGRYLITLVSQGYFADMSDHFQIILTSFWVHFGIILVYLPTSPCFATRQTRI